MRFKTLLSFLSLTISALVTPLEAQTRPAAAKASPKVATTVEYVLVEGADYAFKNPPTVKNGIVTFNLTNVGQDLHAMTLLELPANHTVKEVLERRRGWCS